MRPVKGREPGENPPYGMIGGIEETSASFEARSAPRSYPTVVRHGCLQFERCRPRVGNVDNDEMREVTEQSDRFGEVLRFRLVEVEDHRHVAEVAELVSGRSSTIIRPSVKRPSKSTPFFPMVSITSRIFSLWSSR